MKNQLSSKVNVILGFVVIFCCVGQVLAGTASFRDDFDSDTLDPAWSVVEYSGSYPRAQGYTSPANHYSLTDNPGSLRYYVDPMTYDRGYVNSYQTLDKSTYTYNYDPGLELHREITGDNWVFESKADYYIPYSNARGFNTRIYFGDGIIKTYAVQFTRWTDIHTHNKFSVSLIEFAGSDFTQATTIASDVSNLLGLPYNENSTYYSRLERSGGVLTAMWSVDGSTWNEAFSYDLGDQLDSLDQNIAFVGASWFNSMGAYADYDYVSVNAESETLLSIIDIDPDTFNMKSHGKWITAYITLPEGFDVETIDTSTVAITSLAGESCAPGYYQQADLSFVPQVGDRDEDGVTDLTVKFDRQFLLANICMDDVAITIEGDLTTGEHFSGSDGIRIIARGK